MKHEYEVRISVLSLYKVFVEAESFEEAEELAESMLNNGELYESHSRTDIEAERTDGEPEDEDEED
jgi:hypothetical protein